MELQYVRMFNAMRTFHSFLPFGKPVFLAGFLIQSMPFVRGANLPRR